MTSKFSFYAPSPDVEVTKDVVKEAADGALEVSMEVVPTVTVTLTESESVEEEYFKELAAEEGADAKDGICQQIPRSAAFSEDAASEDDFRADEPADPVEGPKDEDLVQEKQTKEEDVADVLKPEVAKISQTKSDVSEATLASTVASTVVEDEGPSPTFDPSEEAVDTCASFSPAVSHTLATMMRERINAIDNIRTLLEYESKNGDGLRAEFTGKVKTLEEEVAAKKKTIKGLKQHVKDITAKNEEYAGQMTRLKNAIKELVDSNHTNIERMAELEKDVASKNNEIESKREDIREKQLLLNESAEMKAQLAEHLATFKAENDNLRSTVEGLEYTNAEYQTDLGNLTSSLKELVDQNTALEGQVEDLIKANSKLEEDAAALNEKNTELLEVVEGLTDSLNEANDMHNEEVGKLMQKNEVLKNELRSEKETNAATIRELEDILEETTNQMTDQLSHQRESYEAKIAELNKSLDEAKASRKKERAKNDSLQTQISEVARKAADSSETTAKSIGHLEKDLEEEFQISTQLKRDMEEMKKRYVKKDDEEGADELEDLLSSLRKIQCWQLSHFQRINRLVSENKEHARNIDAMI